MPFPLIPLLISAITGAASVAAARIRATRGPGGSRSFVSVNGARPPAIPPPGIMLPPIVGTVATAAGRIAGAIATGAAGAAGFMGVEELIDPATGCPVVRKRRRRRRGITATELRGFNRVNALLCKVGKEPRKPTRKKIC